VDQTADGFTLMLFAAGVFQFVICVVWGVHLARTEPDSNFLTKALNDTESSDRTGETMCWDELSRQDRHGLFAELESDSRYHRRHAVWVLSSLSDSPFPYTDSWPTQNCSDLQLAAGEAVLREWAEWRLEPGSLTERQLIHRMFPERDVD